MHGALLSGNFVSFCSRAGLSPINNNSGVIIVKNRKSCDRQRRQLLLLTIIIIIIIVVYRGIYIRPDICTIIGPYTAASTLRRGVRFSRATTSLRWRSNGQTPCDVFALLYNIRPTGHSFVEPADRPKSLGGS